MVNLNALDPLKKETRPVTSTSHHAHDPPIECKNLWKIYGTNSEKALAAVQADKLGKEECRKRFDCVIGVVDASFSVNEGESTGVLKKDIKPFVITPILRI